VSGGEADPAQIELIRAAMARYRDTDVASAQGWEQEHPDWPETGAHFVKDSDAPGKPGLDLAEPEFLMYSRIGRDDWELVAVAYVVDQALSPEPPTDLQGAAYHQHMWNCIVDGEELDDEDLGAISRDECQDWEGEWSPGGVWMAHVWLIDNPAGIRSAAGSPVEPTVVHEPAGLGDAVGEVWLQPLPLLRSSSIRSDAGTSK
jgi:hypothetical protein